MGAKDKSSKTRKTTTAAIYFMEWAGTALKAYTNTINELYAIPLQEQCTKIKAEDINKTKDPEKLSAESKAGDKDDHDLLVTRLREAASKVTEWSTGCSQAISARNKEVSKKTIHYRL
ncbi:hypothetical protein Y032_0012g1700 [Ancylostoma ceylanicum]|uniref:Uncharacterized protein n=1 Tax=Ancylostoma ceylanicum TaxID=53326 RepID=A0A016VDM3_9BILA|nr:hypothetical protein Y032_0012g1700 [Ancylostoma ceylanicum]